MAEHKAYTCDAGCGAHIAITPPAMSERDYGWVTVLTPSGMPSGQVCSFECLGRYAAHKVGSTLRLDR